MKEELKGIKHAIDGLSDEMLEHRRHANMDDLVKVMKNINDNLVSISFDLKELVEAKKFQNELTTALRQLSKLLNVNGLGEPGSRKSLILKGLKQNAFIFIFFLALLLEFVQCVYMQETIDVTPKWTAVVRILTEVLMSPKSGHEAKCNAVTELLNLAKIVDDQNERIKNDTK